MPDVISADSLSLSCPSSANVGDTIDCTVSATTTNTVSSASIPFTLPNGFSATSLTLATDVDWQGNDISNGKIDAYNSSGATGTFTLGTLKINIGSSATIGANTISLSNGTLFYNKGDTGATLNATSTVNVTNNGSTPNGSTPPVDPTPGDNITGVLKSLRSDNGILAPMFTSTQYSYILTLESDVEQFNLIAEVDDPDTVVTFTNDDTGAVITDFGSIPFQTNGKEEMSISIKVGTVIVNRKKADNVGKAELASLTVGGKIVNLISGKYDYEVYLDDVSSYQVQATLADSTNYKFDDDYLAIPFNGTGENEYAIVILPKVSGESSNTYRLVVKKNGGTAPSTTKPTTTRAPSNPVTGGVMASVMLIIMIAAFGVSYYLYKQTLNQNN